MKPAKIRALFKGIAAGKFPPRVTAKTLELIENDEGEAALFFAMRCGHIPPGTTAKELASIDVVDGYTSLHLAAEFKCLPLNTTVKDLGNCKANDGWTALHAAAEAGALPKETTAQDLLSVKDDDDCSALEVLGTNYLQKINPPCDQVLMVLNNTSSTSHEEMIQIGETLKKQNVGVVGMWMTQEMTKRQSTKLNSR